MLLLVYMTGTTITQISKEDLKSAKDCMEAAGLLGAKEGHSKVEAKPMGPAGQSAPAKFEIQNPQTVGMVVVQENEKAIIRLIQAGMTADGLKMQELSQEVTGDDLKNALSCSTPKAGRGR